MQEFHVKDGYGEQTLKEDRTFPLVSSGYEDEYLN
jgi:hypothetical protein